MEVKGFHGQMDNKARERHHLTMQDLREIQRVRLSLHFAVLLLLLDKILKFHITLHWFISLTTVSGLPCCTVISLLCFDF